MVVVGIRNRCFYRWLVRYCNEGVCMDFAAGSRGVFHISMPDGPATRHLRHRRTQCPIAAPHRAHAFLARYRSKRRHGWQYGQHDASDEFGERLHSFSILHFADLGVRDLNHTFRPACLEVCDPYHQDAATTFATLFENAIWNALSVTISALQIPTPGGCRIPRKSAWTLAFVRNRRRTVRWACRASAAFRTPVARFRAA